MKKFKYRLESLLRIKSHIEREKQKELAAAHQQVQVQESRLAELKSGQSSTLKRQQGKLTGRLCIAELLIHARYLLRLKSESFVGRELLGGLKKKAEEKRVLLVEASRERRKFERLKVKRRERYLQNQKALERKESDEIALGAFRRSKISSPAR